MPKGIPISNEALGVLILTTVADEMEYVDDKPTKKRLGSKYTIIASGLGFASITVKTSEPALPLTQQELDLRNRSGDFAVISPEGLQVELRQNWKTLENKFYGTIDKVVLVSDKGGKLI